MNLEREISIIGLNGLCQNIFIKVYNDFERINIHKVLEEK